MCELDRYIRMNEQYLALGIIGRTALKNLFEETGRMEAFGRSTLIKVRDFLEESKEFLLDGGIDDANRIIDGIDEYILGL